MVCLFFFQTAAILFALEWEKKPSLALYRDELLFFRKKPPLRFKQGMIFCVVLWAFSFFPQFRGKRQRAPNCTKVNSRNFEKPRRKRKKKEDQLRSFFLFFFLQCFFLSTLRLRHARGSLTKSFSRAPFAFKDSVMEWFCNTYHLSHFAAFFTDMGSQVIHRDTFWMPPFFFFFSCEKKKEKLKCVFPFWKEKENTLKVGQLAWPPLSKREERSAWLLF